MSPEQEGALREALVAASHPQSLAKALDWLSGRTPERWYLDWKETGFCRHESNQISLSGPNN
jgi:hypothetical protein